MKYVKNEVYLGMLVKPCEQRVSVTIKVSSSYLLADVKCQHERFQLYSMYLFN